MANEIKLTKTSVKKSDLDKVANPAFVYFAKPVEQADPDTIAEMFRLYRKLFLEIPATGENSHETLVTESSKIYLPQGMSQADIEPLLNEVADLRKRLLEANEQIQTLVRAK